MLELGLGIHDGLPPHETDESRVAGLLIPIAPNRSGMLPQAGIVGPLRVGQIGVPEFTQAFVRE